MEESINGIRMTLFIRRNVNKYKIKYPKLYKAFEIARKSKKYTIGSWLYVSKELYEEYEQLCRNELVINKIPKDNKKVLLTTHTGGKFVGYCINKQWYYDSFHKTKIEIPSIILKWENIRR